MTSHYAFKTLLRGFASVSPKWRLWFNADCTPRVIIIKPGPTPNEMASNSLSKKSYRLHKVLKPFQKKNISLALTSKRVHWFGLTDREQPYWKRDFCVNLSAWIHWNSWSRGINIYDNLLHYHLYLYLLFLYFFFGTTPWMAVNDLLFWPHLVCKSTSLGLNQI